MTGRRDKKSVLAGDVDSRGRWGKRQDTLICYSFLFADTSSCFGVVRDGGGGWHQQRAIPLDRADDAPRGLAQLRRKCVGAIHGQSWCGVLSLWCGSSSTATRSSTIGHPH